MRIRKGAVRGRVLRQFLPCAAGSAEARGRALHYHLTEKDHLTDKGHDLLPTLVALMQWGNI